MEIIETLNNKKVGIYLRKERVNENIITGYGRLQWLRHELEEHEGSIEAYIDEENQFDALKGLVYDVIDGNINAVLIWTIDELINIGGSMLMFNALLRNVPIISFCESPESVEYAVEHVEDILDVVFKNARKRRENNNE